MLQGFSKALDKVLSPMDEATFFEKYWEKEPLLIRREQSDFYSDLVSLETIDNLFSRRDLFYPEIRVFQNGIEVPQENFTINWTHGSNELKGVIDIDKVVELYRQGATFDFRLIERFHQPLMMLCKGIEQRLGFAADASAFLTSKTSGYHIQPHHDIVDGFIMQVGGQKRWRVWRNSLERPMVEDEYSERVTEVDDVDQIGEYILNPGDMLYVPGGLVHAAEPVDSYSLHVTVAVHTPRWLHLLSKLTSNVLEELQDDVRYREALPLKIDSAKSDNNAELHQMFSGMLEDFSQRLNLNQGTKLIHQNLLVGSYPSRPGQLRDLADLPNLKLDDEVQRRETIVFALTESSEQVRLEFHDKVVAFPGFISESVHFISQTPSFAIRDIPGAIDDGSRLVLVRRLMKEGFLTKSKVPALTM